MYTKYLLIILFLIVAYMAYLIIKPFIVTLLTGSLIAYIFYPIYRWIHKKTKRKAVSALIVSILIIVLIAVPTLFIINSITKEAYVSYTIIKQRVLSIQTTQIDCIPGDLICMKTNQVLGFFSEPKVKFYIEDWLTKLTNWFVESTADFIFSLPQKILKLFIMFFVIYYLFKDGKRFVKKIKDHLPFGSQDKKIIFTQFSDITYAVIYGSIVTAIIQGLIGTIGLYIFKVESVLLWGSLMIIAALLPYVGSGIIWGPIGIYRTLTGWINQDSTLMWTGIGLLIYGLLFISIVDNLIKPKLIGNKADLHPVIVLLGVIGGIPIFGIAGLVIGPVILSLFITVLRIYGMKQV